VVVVVADGGKAPMVARALRDGDVPAGRVRPSSGTLTWVLTEAAASEL
jgi:6-phosphogluconolactonase/glucosamine-6-phosphate isomerase/deaminase